MIKKVLFLLNIQEKVFGLLVLQREKIQPKWLLKQIKKLINVFVPTTPNPTSGFLLMFPIDEVIYLNMSFEEASKFIVSAGTSSGNN